MDNVKENELTKLDDITTHVVFQFLKEASDGKLYTDVAYQSWLVLKNDQWNCLYPPPAEYNNVLKYAEDCRSPRKNWKPELIKILSECESFEKAKERLERSFNTSNIESSIESSGASKAKFGNKDGDMNSIPAFDTKLKTDEQKVLKPINENIHKKQQVVKKGKRKSSEMSNIDDAKKGKTTGKKTEVPALEQILESSSNRSNVIEQSTSAPIVKKNLGSVSKNRKNLNPNNIPSTDNVNVAELVENASSYKDLALLMVTLHNNSIKQIRNTKSSIEYNLKDKTNDILCKMDSVPTAGPTKTLGELHKLLKLQGPFENLKDFQAFNTSLNVDDFKKKFKDFILKKANIYDDLKKTVTDIIAELMSKSVQSLYSGCGKFNKLSFENTLVYKSMQEVLESRFEVDWKIIRKCASKYLAESGDRSGGRVRRPAAIPTEKNELVTEENK